ncbi:hypothetical protein FJD35_23070 [Pseudomonas mandelii]|nr:hypothetical protein FJD35_23070 [Pseudomonas mandelii]
MAVTDKSDAHENVLLINSCRIYTPPVGASLLAIAECQPTLMLNVLALSRAGSLPQGTVLNRRNGGGQGV